MLDADMKTATCSANFGVASHWNNASDMHESKNRVIYYVCSGVSIALQRSFFLLHIFSENVEYFE